MMWCGHRTKAALAQRWWAPLTAAGAALGIMIVLLLAFRLAGGPSVGDLLSASTVAVNRFFDPFTAVVSVPSCPGVGGSWWYQGTLLCSTP